MINDSIVVDAVAHCMNSEPSNFLSDLAPGFVVANHGFHRLLSPPEYQLSAESFLIDWQAEDIEQIYVHETDVDIVVYHGVPLDDYFYDGFNDFKKGLDLRQRNPDRVLLYGPLNPLEIGHALEKIDEYAELGVTGLKLYPARWFRGRSIPLRLDDTRYAVPLIERALERGITTIAVHKAMPFGPTTLAEYRVDDVDFAAATYPEMKFEIVHAGYAFLEDTFLQLGRFQNVYANLECVASLVAVRPRRFAEILGNMVYVGAQDRIVFASGCCLLHPQPAIDGLLSFEMPEDMLEDGLPEITDEIKRNILGANYLRMHGIDEDALRSKLAGDDWERARANGKREPYHAMHDRRASTAPATDATTTATGAAL